MSSCCAERRYDIRSRRRTVVYHALACIDFCYLVSLLVFFDPLFLPRLALFIWMIYILSSPFAEETQDRRRLAWGVVARLSVTAYLLASKSLPPAMSMRLTLLDVLATAVAAFPAEARSAEDRTARDSSW
ncbi:MAG: hypothetical protein ACYCOU_00605 [Sulfobacillus sp.]